MTRILIKHAAVINSEKREIHGADILTENGIIARIAPEIRCEPTKTIDAGGLFLAPGLTDMHVHLRDPGQTHKEDIFTGCEAAAAGGFTAVAAMPNTSPVCDGPDTVRYILEKAKMAKARVYPVAAVTKGMRGAELTDFAALKAAGAAAFSDDGRPVASAALMLKAMKTAAELNMPLLSHCEDDTLSGGALMNEGEVSKELGVKGYPAAAEDAVIAREIALSAASGYPVHICHVSTATGAALIRDAKRRGIRVTAETAPHYFTLTDRELLTKNADRRMSPPLRTRVDRDAIITALIDGTIDAIATDHAPHTPEEKSDFMSAPNGVIGLETAFALAYTKLVLPGHIDIWRLIELMSLNPRKLLRLDPGIIREGVPADITLFDRDERWTADKTRFRSKSRNTPFDGMRLTGKIKYTVCRGEIVFEDTP